jgi:hypothetical protein
MVSSTLMPRRAEFHFRLVDERAGERVNKANKASEREKYHIIFPSCWVESEADLDMQLSERSGPAGGHGLLATTSSLDETLSKMEAEIAAMEQLHN